MKKRIPIIISLLITAIVIIGCVKKLEKVTTALKGRIIEETSMLPLNNVNVVVTNGISDYTNVHTGVTGTFKLDVNFDDISDGYYLYLDDGSHTKKLELKGIGKVSYDYKDIALYNNGGGASTPTVSTSTPTNITSNTASCGGKVTSDGGATVIQRGICYNTLQNPTTANSVITCGTGTGEFACLLAGLSPNTKYYVKAYAINSQGTSYGTQKVFTTSSGGGGGGSATTPTVTTTTPTNVTSSTAACGGNVTSDGGTTIIQRGICYSTSQNPTTANHVVTSGTGTGSFTCNLTGLSPNTKYYVKAYAINSEGTSYGTQKEFTTSSGGGGSVTEPIVTTSSVSNVTTNSAICGGNITSDGGANITARGVCWSTSQNPTISNQHTTDGTGTGQFTSTITGLSANTTYYVRAYATNSAGTSYGSQKTFTTSSGGGSAVEEFSESFEAGIPSNWATIDADGDGKNWKRASIGMSGYTIPSHTGSDCVYSESYNSISGALTPNNYLVSPLASIVSGSTFSFYACAQDASYAAEHFGVAVSTTTPTASSFTMVQEWTLTAKGSGVMASGRDGQTREQGNWYQYSVDLTAYTGQQIYIAIRHFNCTDMFYLDVDDVQLSKNGGGNTTAPTVTTTTPTNVTTNAATCGGNVTSDGGATVTQRGVCYSTSQNPTTSNTVVTSGSGNGAFTCNLTGLSPNTTYYVRAFATNSVGTSYGTQKSFTTSGGSSATTPTVTTTTPTNVTTNSATCGGNVTSDGGATVTQRGVCYSTSQNPTTSNTVVTSGSGNGAFTCNLTGLSPNTTYYVRAFAINSEGTAYGSPVPFTTTSESISGWLYYDDPNIVVGHAGLTNGGTLYWANMYPSSMLAPYAGTSVVKLEAHLDLTGNYILQIYQGGNDGPSTLLLNDNCDVYEAGGYVVFTFDTPMNFDASQNLWVVIGNTHSSGEHPAGYSNLSNDLNSRWCSIDGTNWGDSGYTWILHTYVSNTGEKGGQKLVEIRHTNNDNDIKTNIDN